MSKKNNIKKRLIGSGTLVVIFSAIAFSIYVVSNFAEQEHYGIIQKKYEDNIIKEYEKNINNIDEYYDNILNLQDNI